MSEQTADSGLPGLVVGIGNFIEATMSTQWVILIIVPILVTAGAIALKRSSRKFRQKDPADSLFGFDLGVTACLTLMVAGFVLLNRTSSSATAADRQHYVVGLFVVLIGFIVLLAVAAHRMHKRGWDNSTPPKPTTTACWIVNAGGVVQLVSAFVLTGGTFP